MALLSFPPTPFNGEIYPPTPLPGQSQYQWSSTYQTWELLGTATAVVPGTYGNSLAVGQFTVDATGRIVFAQDVPIQASSTTQPGVVQLTDDTISNDATTALTAAQGYKLQNEIGDTSLLNPFYPNLVTAVNAANGVTGVTAGTYGSGSTVGRFTVNTQGRITAASSVSLTVASTTAPGVVTVGSNLAVTPLGVLSVPAATTTTAGAVTLVNNTTTNDATKALTAAAGYTLQQEVTALQVKQNTTFAGTLNVVTGLMTSVTPEAAALGFAVNAPLISPFPSTNEYFVIVTTPGTYQPPGSTVFIATYVGDWFQSNGSQWIYYPTGIRYATTAAPGVVEIGNNISVTGVGEISVANASTTTRGVVQLVDDTITNDPTKALTAAAGYVLQQQISAVTVSTLQAVTDNGSTTTNNITLNNSDLIVKDGGGVTRIQLSAGTSLFSDPVSMASIGAATTNPILTIGNSNSLLWQGATAQTVRINNQSIRLGQGIHGIDIYGQSVAASGSYSLRLPDAQGGAGTALINDGAGNLAWLATAEVVAEPTSSADTGTVGQIAFGNGFFYWFDPTSLQWLRVAGNTF